MSELKLWTNGCEWVVAPDVADAVSVWEKHTGERAVDYDHQWREDTRAEIKVTDDEGSPDEIRSAAEWVEFKGRGYLWNTEDR